jgi:hypothetical protein
MNKTSFLALRLLLVGLWLAGCGSGVTPTELPSTRIPTETKHISTSTPLPTETPPPTATSTAQLLPISAEASAYLNEALDIMQKNSLHRESIDWDTLREATFEVAKYAQTPADTYGAIRFALVRLGDHHSLFITPYEREQRVQETESDSPPPRGKLLLEQIGYIAIDGYTAYEGDQYATDVQQLIRAIDAQNPCGWIVDLRENTGGNMWPMLAGVGPILGEGEAGAFVDSYGNKALWSYQDGKAMAGDTVSTQVIGPAYELRVSLPPVAVLTGVNTASSGEVIVVSFRGRPNTRSFGLYTTGLSTANQGFPLSDGAVIALTTSVYADRTGQTYGDRIYPDELIDDVRRFTVLMGEAIPQPAIDWLMSQPACSEQK